MNKMQQLWTAWITRFGGATVVRYGAVSVVALAADMGSFLGFLALAVPATAAAALAYCIGIVVHWLLSSRLVFAERVADRGLRRTRQKAMFLASALIGLGLTALIVWTADASGIDARIGKLVAIVISFGVTYVLRNSIVFRHWA
ncbi:MAG: GtrA family protein [Pseudomonadota bacterium]